MANQTFQACEITRIQDATQILNTTTETIMVPDLSFAANYFTQGRTLRVTIAGVTTSVITTPGNITFRVRLGPLTGTSATLSAASQAIALDGTAASTNFSFRIEYMIVCRSAGTTGTVLTMGQINVADTTNSLAANGYLLPQSAPATSAIDTTAPLNLANSAQFSVPTATTALTAMQYVVESLN